MPNISIYPDAIDGYEQLPLVVDRVTPIDAVTVNRLREVIIKIEEELGVLPSSSFDTVKARLDAIELIIDEELSEQVNVFFPSAAFGPRQFVFRPGGVAEGNVYTDFDLLYADLDLALGHKVIVLDDEGVGSIAIPDGTFDLTDCEVTNGKVSSEDAGENKTTVTWGTSTQLRDVSRWENLRFAAGGSGLGSPIVYTKDRSVTMVGCWFYGQLSSDPIVVSVPAGTNIGLLWELQYSNLGYIPSGGGFAVPSEPVLAFAGAGDTVTFTLKGSLIARDAVTGGASDAIDAINVDPGSTFINNQPNFAGTLPTALPGGSAVAYDGGTYNDWGIFPAPSEVQDTLTRLVADENRTYLGSGIVPVIETITIATDSANTLDIMVSAVDPVANDSASWFIRALVEDQGGAQAIVGSSGTGVPAFATGGAVGWTTAIGMSFGTVAITGGAATADTEWTVKVTSAEAPQDFF